MTTKSGAIVEINPVLLKYWQEELLGIIQQRKPTTDNVSNEQDPIYPIVMRLGPILIRGCGQNIAEPIIRLIGEMATRLSLKDKQACAKEVLAYKVIQLLMDTKENGGNTNEQENQD